MIINNTSFIVLVVFFIHCLSCNQNKRPVKYEEYVLIDRKGSPRCVVELFWIGSKLIWNDSNHRNLGFDAEFVILDTSVFNIFIEVNSIVSNPKTQSDSLYVSGHFVNYSSHLFDQVTIEDNNNYLLVFSCIPKASFHENGSLEFKILEGTSKFSEERYIIDINKKTIELIGQKIGFSPDYWTMKFFSRLLRVARK